ncbi:hypothetical protein TNCV_3479931 [Trichonephila clavipes]|nr:hypothetical protein TNCV_3479931 [Trichonephila clavipes]
MLSHFLLFYEIPMRPCREKCGRISVRWTAHAAISSICKRRSWPGGHWRRRSLLPTYPPVHGLFLSRKIKRRFTEMLMATDHVILNHGQVTWTTPELAHHTNGLFSVPPAGGAYQPLFSPALLHLR